MSWTRAIHLIHWANTQDSRHQLPALLRKLIRATVPGEKMVNFPAGEQVQRSGFDGIVEVAQGNQFVPTGKSAWETGVNRDKKGKADADFLKRTESTPPDVQAETTFVFVTPRTWVGKDEWEEERRNESNWKDVVVWDANDLEHCIEIAPAVDVWLSVLMGRRPAGVIDAARHWSALAAISNVTLKPSVFLSSRESTVDSITRFLQAPSSSAFVKSGGPDEGVDFLTALIEEHGSESVDLDRSLIVTEIEAWRHLAISREPLLLVAASNLQLSATDVSDAVTGGHHVLVTGAVSSAPPTTEIPLPRQGYFELCRALTDCGFDDARAQSVSAGCCGSSTILKRLITQHADRVFPKWSQDDFRTTLAPFALIGGWVNVDPEPRKKKDPFGIVPDPPLDLWCIEQLGLARAEVGQAVTRWSVGDEPLFIQFRDSVLVASREDAWFLLGGSLTRDHLQWFEVIAVLILDEDNPALKLAADKRWMANMYGKVHSLSGELRRSIVESLALMATYPTAIEPASNVDFRDTVSRVLERILPSNAPWQRWASFGGNLPLLFECDPDFFLSRIESDLRGETPQLPQLFQDQTNGFFGSSLHCNLLWALEGLAWSTEYIGRATLALAQLAAQIQIQSGNHPSNSLNATFLLWMPHTNATIGQRIEAIERIVQVEPDVGWNLITSLLPNTLPGHSILPHMPRWRPWAHGWKRETASAEMFEYGSRFGDLVLRLAARDTRRWSQIMDGMLRLGGAYTDSVIARLEEMASSYQENTDEAFDLWDKLRELTYLHSRHRDAPWAFTEDILTRIVAVRDSLVPQDAVLRNHWLFNNQVQLLPDIDEREFEKHDAVLKARRVDALKAIVAERGYEGVQQLLARVDNFYIVGWIIGEHELLTASDLGLPAALETGEESACSCAAAFCGSRFKKERWSFVESLPVAEWTPQQVATFAACLQFGRDTWEWIASASSEAEPLYWQKCRPYLRSPTIEDIDFAVEQLLAVGRPFAAADFLFRSMHGDSDIDSDRILSLLENGLAVEGTEDCELINPYPIQELIKRLQDDGSVDRLKLARVEWGYLPLLDRHSSRTTPETLFRSLQTEPELFVELLKVQFCAEDEEPRENPLSEHENHIAEHHAQDLLDQLNALPGTDEDGVIDPTALNTWVDGVRELAAAAKRLGIGDHHLGKLLAHVPIDEEMEDSFGVVVATMERIGSCDMLEGFESGVIGNRGITTRLPTSGGELERKLVEKYRAVANSIRPNSPKVAEVFDQLARHYEDDAKWHDANAERRRLGR